METESLISLKPIVSAFVYSGVGLLVLTLSFKVFDWLTPGQLWKEVVEEKNIALAIATGAVTLAIAQIIAAAIHG